MTNLAILEQECRNRGITEVVHTFAKWKSLGYKVKKGEHALFSTQLWKHSSRTKHNDETNEDEEKESMYMTKAFLFGERQVEKIEEE
ncbi:MAG: ArdC-like ssDNA-binding domain-containing protein [Clostridia bacterium]